MTAIREFFLIVAGGALGAGLGTGFGALVGVWFPGFIEQLCRPEPVGDAVEVAAGMGMTAGLPIGAAAMAAARVIGAVRDWALRRAK